MQRLEERMAGLQPGTLRYQALEAAKRFKASWIDLGRTLYTVHREKRFREWGYLTFEAYCAKEVGVRAATAKKLLHSYYFLEREEPALLKQIAGAEASPAQLPSPEAVNLLRLLKKRAEVPAGGYERIRSDVLEKGREVAQVRQEVRELLQKPDADPEEVEKARAVSSVRRMLGTLKAIRTRLAEADLVPRKILDEIAALSKKLEDLL